MKKKILALSMALLFAVTLASPTIVDASEIRVIVNGQRVHFEDQQPVIVNARVLVPARGTFEAMGFYVSWDDEARQSTLSRANDVIVLTMDSTIFTFNGAYHTLDAPAQLINGRAMLPIRAALENFSYYLGWDGATDTVIIIGTTPATEQPPVQQPPTEQPPAQQPPAQQPPTQQPPAQQPSGEAPEEEPLLDPDLQLRRWASWFGMTADQFFNYATQEGRNMDSHIHTLGVTADHFWRVISYAQNSR